MDETGVPAVDAVLVWGGALSLGVGLLTLAWRLVRSSARLVRRAETMMDDWQGEYARPGVPARPGVMERMAGLESRMGGVERDLRRLTHELYPNSGGSLRDAVDLANRRLCRLCPDEECRSASGARLVAHADDLDHGPDRRDGDDDGTGDDDGDDQGESGGGAHGTILPPRRGPDQGNHSQD